MVVNQKRSILVSRWARMPNIAPQAIAVAVAAPRPNKRDCDMVDSYHDSKGPHRVASLRVTVATMIHALLLAAVSATQPCTAAENHQFDFWLGNWTVTTKAGKPAGKDLVTRDYDGCVVIEHW